MSNVREELVCLGWRQGSIIEAGAIENEILSGHEADAFLIMNQTCDLINPSWKKEPIVELLPLARVAKPDSNFLNGRNPRQIQFAVKIAGAESFVGAFAPGTVALPRHTLLESSPSSNWSMDESDLKSLLAWRAARYLRTAFPDAFEDRLKSVFGEFKKLIQSIHTHLHSLHVRIEPFSPAVGEEPYEMDLLLVARRNSSDDPITRESLIRAAKSLENLINSAEGLVCISCKVRAPHEVTMEEIEGYIRWERHDYLSFGEDE